MESKTEIAAAKCTRVPIEQLTSIEKKDLVQVFCEYWWVVDQNNNALFFKGYSPLCNFHQVTAEGIRDRLCPDFKIIQIAAAFIPIKCNDFDYNV